MAKANLKLKALPLELVEGSTMEADLEAVAA